MEYAVTDFEDLYRQIEVRDNFSCWFSDTLLEYIEKQKINDCKFSAWYEQPEFELGFEKIHYGIESLPKLNKENYEKLITENLKGVVSDSLIVILTNCLIKATEEFYSDVEKVVEEKDEEYRRDVEYAKSVLLNHNIRVDRLDSENILTKFNKLYTMSI